MIKETPMNEIAVQDGSLWAASRLTALRARLIAIKPIDTVFIIQ
jgi:hypothetical protein